MNATEVAALVESGVRAWREGRRRVSPPRSNRAGDMGDPCVRKLVYARLQPELLKLHPVERQEVFDLGDIVERATVRELEDSGFRWVQGQRPFRDAEHDISGMIDGGINFDGAVYPTEIKSMQTHAWKAVRSGPEGFADMLRARSWWLRKYPYQISTYLHLTGEPAGFLVLRDKQFWGLKVVPVVREYVGALIEHALFTAKTVNEFLAKRELPPRIDYDPSVCGICDFHDACLPPRVGEGVQWIESPELLDLLVERDELAPKVRRYDAVDEEVKTTVRALGRVLVVGGKFEIVNRSYPRKAKDGSETETIRTSIRRLDAPEPQGGDIDG